MKLTNIYGAHWQVYEPILILLPREGHPEGEKDQKDLHAAGRRQAEALLVSSRSSDLPIYSISHVENEGNDYYCAIIMVRFHNSISI